MRRVLVIILFVLSAGAVTWATRLALHSYDSDNVRQQHPQPTRPVAVSWVASTEQEWIVTSVALAIDGIARNSPDVVAKASIVRPGGRMTAATTAFDITVEGTTRRVPVVNHLWSPDMYVPMAASLLGGGGGAGADGDLSARAVLVDRSVATLLKENTRISEALDTNMRSAPAHEAAALLVGVMELREGTGFFTDPRPALSRMTAHLAVAAALRGGAPAGPDGVLALAMLTNFAGLQRQALAIVDRFDAQFTAATDRAWSHALRLLITRNWRLYKPAELTTFLEQVEYARALRESLDEDAMLDYLDSLEEAPPTTEWHRNALSVDSYVNVETGHRFASTAMLLELAEAAEAWHAFHDGDLQDANVMIAALNDRAAPTPIRRAGTGSRVQVLDWGRWAELAQRQVVQAIVLQATHARNLRDNAGVDELRQSLGSRLEKLTLYPLVARWMVDMYDAPSVTDYEKAIVAAWPLAQNTPELLTAVEWNYLLQPLRGTRTAARFPLDRAWFEPGTPVGTAFDLGHRSLQPGCRWPADLEDARRWADEQPYDWWAQWSAAWLPVKGKPSFSAVRKNMAAMLDYNVHPWSLIYADIDLTREEQLGVARTMCDLVPGYCATVGELLLLDHREADAASAYETYVAKSRDTVAISNSVLWLVRYYRDTGRMSDAHRLAEAAGKTGSATGMRTYGEQLEVEGRQSEAEALYRDILETYDGSVPLGTFLLKRALATQDKTLESHAQDMLRPLFPEGLQRPRAHELDAVPADGAFFKTFGRRPAAMGFQPNDIIVVADGWRVRNANQLIEAMRLTFDPAATFVVWRDGRYREIRTSVPQRRIGVIFNDYVPSGTKR